MFEFDELWHRGIVIYLFAEITCSKFHGVDDHANSFCEVPWNNLFASIADHTSDMLFLALHWSIRVLCTQENFYFHLDHQRFPASCLCSPTLAGMVTQAV